MGGGAVSWRPTPRTPPAVVPALEPIAGRVPSLSADDGAALAPADRLTGPARLEPLPLRDDDVLRVLRARDPGLEDAHPGHHRPRGQQQTTDDRAGAPP